MSTFVDLGPSVERVVALLPGVRDDHLDAPTPSVDTPVADLLSHLIMLSAAFRGAAEKAPDPGLPGRPPALVPDWRTVLPARLDALAAAWRVPGARDGMASVGGIEMPSAAIAVVALDEIVLHGWDLARATGQPYEADPVSVEACIGFVSSMVRPEGVPGLFGPPVQVPDDAPALDRLLGLSGRDPAWSRPVRAGGQT